MTDICYVLPYHAPGDDQHYAHIPALLVELAKRVNLFVIVQRGRAPDVPGARMVLIQRESGIIGRYLELRRLARAVRRAGCRRFFVRISLSAALALLIPPAAPNLEVYYWNSGQGRGVWPPWRQLVRRMRAELGDRLLRLAFRRATKVTTGPESMVEYLHLEYGVPRSRLLLLYNDVDCGRFRPLTPSTKRTKRVELGLDQDGIYALFVGRLSHYKGGDYLPKLASELRGAVPGIRLLAIGKLQLPITGAVPPSLEYLGSRPNEILPLYYGAADIFILPSRSEGFPRVLLEAMAVGLPVVAFDVGGVRDILPLEQHRFIVPSSDLKSFREAVVALARDRSLRFRLGRLNRQRAERYSTERVAIMFADRIAGAS